MVFLHGGVRGALEGKDYRAFHTVFPNVCSFIDRGTGYTKSSKIASTHAMYSSLMCRVLSGSWKRGSTNEELKGVGAELFEIRKEVVELFASGCMLGLYTIKFQSLDHMLEDIRAVCGHISSACFCS